MWTDGTLVSFDTETTGVDPETARIVTASVVIIDGTTGNVTKHEWLADPGIDIPDEAAKVHGITTEKARADGDDPCTVTTEICRLLADEIEDGTPLIVYNASYDVTLLDRECRRHGTPTLHERAADDGFDIRVVDPLCLDRALDPYRRTKHVGGRTLTTVSAHYGVPISEHDAHGSTQDALCAARVAWKIGKRFPAECGDLVVLQDFQRRQHAAWAKHTNEYFRSQGKPGDISTDWPYRPLPVEVNA